MLRQELRLTGSGGQGLILAGIILAEAAFIWWYECSSISVLWTRSFRGGKASKAEVIISKDEINYPKVNECDIMLTLTQAACDKYIKSLKPGEH